jgi:hypothetical protein
VVLSAGGKAPTRLDAKLAAEAAYQILRDAQRLLDAARPVNQPQQTTLLWSNEQ